MLNFRQKVRGGLLMLLLGASGWPAQAQEPTNLSETYGAWTVYCQSTAVNDGASRLCRISQELLQQGTRRRVLLFSVSPSNEGGAKATIVAPLGVVLSAGLTVKIEDGEIAGGPFKTCLNAGCITEMDLAEGTIDQLSAAEKASVTAMTSPDKPLTLEISLQGFAAAYQRLTALVDG